MKKNVSTALFTLVMLISSMSGCEKDNGNTGNESKQEVSTKLDTPANVTITNKVVTWNAVNNATEYVVIVGSTEYKVNTNSFDLNTIQVEEGASIKVKATSAEYRDSEVSLSVKYESINTDTRVNYVKNILSEKLSIDFTNPTELLKYQEPLTSMVQTMNTYNVKEEELGKILLFASSLSNDIEKYEFTTPDDLLTFIMTNITSFVEAKLDSKLLLSLAKNVISIGIIKAANEKYEPNNGYGIKAKQVASYLAKMQDADVAKISKLLDYFNTVYSKATNRLINISGYTTVGEKYAKIKDIIIDELRTNLPTYVEIKEIGNAIYNVLSPLDTESKALKKAVNNVVSSCYQLYDGMLFAASKLDAEFLDDVIYDVSGIAEIVMNIATYSDPYEFMLGYSNVELDEEGLDELNTGLFNLIYNFRNIMFETTFDDVPTVDPYLDDVDFDEDIGDDDEEPVYYGETHLNSEFAGLLQSGLFGFISAIVANSGLNTDTIGALMSTTGEDAYSYLTALYEGLELDEVIPFVEGKNMHDFLTVVSKDISMNKIGSLSACESVSDVIVALGLNTVFEFNENTAAGFKHLVGDDFITFVNELQLLIASEESSPVAVATYILTKLDIQTAFVTGFADAINFLDENFAVSYYPAIIAGIIAHAASDMNNVVAYYTDLASVVEAKIGEIKEAYVPATVDEIEPLTALESAELANQINHVFMTEREIKIEEDVVSLLENVLSGIEEDLAYTRVILGEYSPILYRFEGKNAKEIVEIIMNDNEGDILPDFEIALTDTFELIQDYVNDISTVANRTTLEAIRDDILDYIKYDMADEEAAEVAEEEIDNAIESYLGLVANLKSVDAEEIAAMICDTFASYRTQANETTDAVNKIYLEIQTEITGFMGSYSQEDNPLVDLMEIELPENVTSLENLNDFLVAYLDEDFKVDFKNWFKDNYVDVVTLLGEIADLNDDAVKTLDKYYYESYWDEDIQGSVKAPYVSEFEGILMGLVAAAEQQDVYELAYGYVDMAIQILQAQVLVTEVAPE